MKKKMKNKLTLNKATVTNLNESQQLMVRGGGVTEYPDCDTELPECDTIIVQCTGTCTADYKCLTENPIFCIQP